MTEPTRRRKGEKEVLPSHVDSGATYSNSKRKKKKQIVGPGTCIALGVILIVGTTLGIVTIIGDSVAKTTTSPRGWRKLAHKVSSHVKRVTGSPRGQGCFGVDIHKIAQQEPNPPGLCINDPHLMPLSWRAPDDLVFKDKWGPWTAEEQALADEAVDRGLDELIGFFEHATEEQIKRLGTDATNSIFDYVVSSQEMPEFHRRAVTMAIKVLKINAEDYADKDYEAECTDMFHKISYAGYAYRLAQEDPDDKELGTIRDTLIDHLGDSIEECGTLDMMRGDGKVELAWREAMKRTDRSEEVVYNWFMWSVALTNCLTIPGLKMPHDTEEFIARTWKYFQNYNLSGYKDYEARDDPRGTFVQMAYLATHLQFIPTGYGRHYAYVKDAPYLYHYYRENYFAAMNEGGHDLIAEFIDMITTYGCGPENDIQVRHGMRYMLHLYQKAGHSFVNYLEPYERKDTLSDYDKIHKVWTGIATLETKGCFEPEIPGSYGYAFRKALKSISDF